MKKVVCRIGPSERLKNLSAMFRYNGIIVDLLKDQVIMSDYTVDGYAPLYGEMKKSPKVKTIDGKPIQDTLKLNMMEESIARMSQVETRLVMVASPKYGATSSETFNPTQGNVQSLWCGVFGLLCRS